MRRSSINIFSCKHRQTIVINYNCKPFGGMPTPFLTLDLGAGGWGLVLGAWGSDWTLGCGLGAWAQVYVLCCITRYVIVALVEMVCCMCCVLRDMCCVSCNMRNVFILYVFETFVNIDLEAEAWGSKLGARCLVFGVSVGAWVGAWGLGTWAYVLRFARNVLMLRFIRIFAM